MSKEKLECNFCNKTRQEVSHLVKSPDNKVFICNECIDFSAEVISQDKNPLLKNKKSSKIYTPSVIKENLDKHVVGQEETKKALSVAIYNHCKRVGSIDNQKQDVKIDKSNVLMVGPSGSGKTLLVKTISDYLDIPLAITDATSFTEAGYSGDDVESVLTRLIESTNGDLDKAECGIVFIDEIDKKAKSNATSTDAGKDVSGEGVQQSLLKIIEGTTLPVHYDNEWHDIDTSNMLFVFSGAFVGIEELTKNKKKKMGFAGTQSKNHTEGNDKLQPEHLIKYGLIPELVGRIPVIVETKKIDMNMMMRIITEPKDSILKQYQSMFKMEDVTLVFNKNYIAEVAQRALDKKVGARGIRSIVEHDLMDLQYDLPEISKNVEKITITKGAKKRYTYKKEQKLRRISNNGKK